MYIIMYIHTLVTNDLSMTCILIRLKVGYLVFNPCPVMVVGLVDAQAPRVLMWNLKLLYPFHQVISFILFYDLPHMFLSTS